MQKRGSRASTHSDGIFTQQPEPIKPGHYVPSSREGIVLNQMSHV